MDSKTIELEDKVEALTQEVAELTRRLLEMERRTTKHYLEFDHRIFLLTFGKLADPRTPYCTWLLERGGSKELSSRIDALFTLVDARLTGEEIADYYRERVKDDISEDLLHGSGPPAVADVIAAFKRVARIDTPSELRDLIKSRNKQNELYDAVCKLVLAEIGE